jgi:hypothetical protein
MFSGKYIRQPLFVLLASTLFINVATAAIPNNDSPSTFVGPFVHGSFTNDFNPASAFSIGADLGPRNYRLGGTLGFESTANQRFKVSAEWLEQDIAYAYFSGNTTQWVDQAVIGGNYSYYFESRYFDPVFILDAYYQHGSSSTLRTNSGTYTNQAGLPSIYVNRRRIAGADAAGIAPGVLLSLSPHSRVGATLNYDNVVYDTAYVSNKDAKGLGGTINATQYLSDDVSFAAEVAFLQAYNNYAARVNLGNVSFYGTWLFSVEGNYTIGKNTMPDTYNVGVNIDYQLDRSGITSFSIKSARETFLNWVAQPTARKPQVLGLADQQVLIAN